MRVLRWMFGGLLVSALLLAALWASAPWWLARLAQHELAGMGFDTPAMRIEAVGPAQTRIGRLHVRRADGSLEIEAGRAILAYSIPALLHLHVDSLKLETLDIAVFPLPRSAERDAPGLLSPAAVFAALPVGRIDVERISLRRFDAGHALSQALTGRASYAGKALQLELGEPDAQGVQAMLSLDASGDCGARVTHAGMEIARMHCRLSPHPAGMLLQGDVQADLAGLDRLLAVWVSMPHHRIEGRMQATWKVGLPGGAGGRRQPDIESTLHVSALTDAWQLSLNGRVSYAEGKGAWAIADDSQLSFGTDRRSRLSFAGMKGGFSPGDAPALVVDSGGALQVQNLTGGEANLPQMDARLLNDVPLSFSDGILLDRPVDIALHMSRLDRGENRLFSRGMRLHLEAGKLLAPAGSLVVDGLRLEAGGVSLPVGRLQADVRFAADTSLTAQGGFVADEGILELDGKLSHDLATGDGRLELHAVPLRFPSAAPLLRGFVPQGDELLLQGGSLTASAKLTWSEKGFSTVLALHLAGMRGAYRAYAFSGLSGNVKVIADARGLRLSSGKLSAQSIDPGLPLSDVAMRARLDYPFRGKPALVLQDVHAQALGGVISSQSIAIDTARDSNPFVLRLEHVEVRQLVEFRKQEGLFAGGLLDGTLPFDWTDKGLKMTAGSLDARMPGGLIRYLGTASMRQMAASDKVLGMAMQVLNDFRFKVLHTQADYQPDGRLALHIELKGSNPGYENGRPIELNLNIEENVLKLLQSLRAAGEIGERVEKGVKQKMQE